MDRNLQRTGLVNLLVLLALALTGFGVGRYTHFLSGQMASVFLALGCLSALISYFQMHLEERERLEKMDLDEMNRSAASSSTLFDSDNPETSAARRAREQFEKYFVPGFTVLLFLLEAGGAFWLWRWLGQPVVATLSQPVTALGVFGMTGLVLFLIGKYSAGLVRLQGQRLLSPSASYLLLGAYLYYLVAAVAGIVWGFKLPSIDVGVARALCILLMLLAAESLISLLLETYRPRVKGKIVRLLYESRLVGLLSHPEGLITTAAQALDYQFGFKVSETWFYRFMERALGWLLLAQLAVLVLSTSFVFIQTGEEALLERFGTRVPGREVLQPGFHLKYPWPIDRVHRFRTREIQTLNIGFEHDEDDDDEKTILWTVSHARQEFLLLVAAREASPVDTNKVTGKKLPPVSLLSASIPVRYHISNLTAWAYNHADATNLLEDIATREVVRYMVSADLQEVISTGRSKAAQDLRNLLQARATDLALGVTIVSVGLPDIHPPVAVAAAYEQVVAARQRREANILAAQAHRISTNALAAAEALRRRREALAERRRVEVTATAEAARFTSHIPAYEAAPQVYTQRAYLETLAAAGKDVKKIIIASTNTQDVILLDLQEKVRADITDLVLPTPKAE